MLEMEKVGRDYLGDFATEEWWDIFGTDFEKVYGRKHMERVAGFTAATAPNRAPRENLQVMTEYMRRQISGEPVIQPNFRIPEGTMSRNAGTQLGMEATMRKNLLLIEKGEVNKIGKDKIKNEADALLGDPNAVVLDRHWARLAEDPARGIFTDVQEGVLKPGKPYQLIKEQVTRVAKKQGRTPRNFSADVWTGIRETIKNNSELFGTKFRRGSISGDSKSYADHFTDLIADKAKHMGISVEEMSLRLRKGDVNLLSTLLATPIGGVIYQQYLVQSSDGDGNS